MTWNPTQYEQFKDERSRPFFDLLALVRLAPQMRVLDLGCGTGELTRAMHVAIGARETIGVDSSEAMLAGTAALSGEGLRFERRRIEDVGDGDGLFDLVFSNAALHWVDDHPALFAHLAGMLLPGGQLAVQIPSNEDQPSHVVAAEVAREEPFAAALRGYVRRVPNLRLEEYAALFDRIGFAEQHVATRVYAHHLAGREDVVEWVKGSLLTDYEKRLPQDLWPRFVDRYRAALLPRLDDGRPFLFPFKRTFLWGKKAG